MQSEDMNEFQTMYSFKRKEDEDHTDPQYDQLPNSLSNILATNGNVVNFNNIDDRYQDHLTQYLDKTSYNNVNGMAESNLF